MAGSGGAWKPYFFKVMLGDFYKPLRIPATFQKHIANENSERAILEVSCGHQWQVKLSEDNMYLQDGWPTFVKDNSLVKNNFLLFKYEGSLHFRVLIFDETACERQNSIAGSSCQECIKLRDMQKGVSSGFDHHFQEKSCGVSNYLKFQNNCGSIPSQRRSFVGLAMKEQEVDMCKFERSSARCHFSPRVKEKFFDAYISFTSKFPFFKKYIEKSHVHTFVIPSSFARVHLPRQDAELILRDPNRRQWKVKYYTKYKDLLVGGWSSFCRSNNLKEKDRCIFELVDQLVMQVHIFYSADLPPISERARTELDSRRKKRLL